MFYEYVCKNCKIEREVQHSIKEDPQIYCESCGELMKKIITGGIGEIYRGLGWPRKGTGTAPTPKRTTEHVLMGRPRRK